MRIIPLFVPIVVVAGYVIHDAVSDRDTQVATPEPTAQVVEATPQQMTPVALAVPPTPAPTPQVPAAELSTQLAALADLALAIPVAVESEAAMLQDLRVHASAKADIAATIAGLVQIIEQQVNSQLDEDEVMAMTGSVLAELAATLEAHLEVAAQGAQAPVPDTSRGN